MASPPRLHGRVPDDSLSVRYGTMRENRLIFRTGRFGHMFPPSLAKPTANEAALKELADAMRDTRPEGDASSNNDNVPAGFTYLGQFIDHDITLDITSLNEVQRDKLGERNFRTPQLELDSVYGGGPDASPHLYDRLAPGKLLIGVCGPGGGGDAGIKAGLPFDLPRGPQGLALLGDPRNDENLLVAQTHLAFLKFHNAVFDRQGGKDFARTRKLVRWHYQWIVLHDFLTKLIDNNELQDVLTNGRKFYLPEHQSDHREAYMPVEFSGAAYRLGHSMVREVYSHNRAFRPGAGPSTFNFLFHFTGKSGGIVGDLAPPPNDPANAALAQQLGLLLPFVFPRLPGDWPIDWHRFFQLGAPKPPPAQAAPADNGPVLFNPSRRIDPRLVPALHALPGGGSLPFFNLKRGVKLDLPSGQAVAQHMGVRVLTEAQIADGSPDGVAAAKHGMHRSSPLWYYILKEAQKLGDDGNRLGPVGSRILAEVFVGLLQTDPEAYLHVDQEPGWKPTLPSAFAGTFRMTDLLRYVDAAEPGFLNPINEASSF